MRANLYSGLLKSKTKEPSIARDSQHKRPSFSCQQHPRSGNVYINDLLQKPPHTSKNQLPDRCSLFFKRHGCINVRVKGRKVLKKAACPSCFRCSCAGLAASKGWRTHACPKQSSSASSKKESVIVALPESVTTTS